MSEWVPSIMTSDRHRQRSSDRRRNRRAGPRCGRGRSGAGGGIPHVSNKYPLPVFYITRQGRGLCVRPHRYALALATGEPLGTTLAANTTTAEKLQRIGKTALSTPTVAESVRREVIAGRLPSHEWPDRVLRIPAIDTASGELVAFDRGSGVALVDAVAASCAVPGAWPPVTIGDRRYMDGGVDSTINLALAGDCDVAVVLVPAGRSAPSPFGGGGAAEIDAFRGSAFGVFADDQSLTAFGANPLDPACRVPSARAGREQGRRVAGDIAEFFD